MRDEPTIRSDATSRPARPIGIGFIVIGSELAAATLTGVAVDYWVGTRGVFTVALTLAGMVAAVLLTMRLLRDEQRSGGGK